jgi:hypothetical protein
MARSRVLDEIRTLDPERDHQRIVFLSTTYDFSFDMTRSLEFALFRTYCVPRISGLLDQTGEFRQRAQKRYDDTDLIVSELIEYGYESDRGRAALRTMNGLHSRFDIANPDYLYVLSTFVFEPIRWNERFGWRAMIEAERLALFYFWRAVGRRMGIKDLPDSYDGFERYNVAYEREQYRFSESNRRIGGATRDLFVSWFPGPLHVLIRAAIHAIMDDAVLTAFGFPQPSAVMRRLVVGTLKVRAIGLRLLPPRRRPKLRTLLKHRSYPSGYQVESLGPP